MCVLYNAAAMASVQAARKDLNTSEGLKHACQQFQVRFALPRAPNESMRASHADRNAHARGPAKFAFGRWQLALSHVSGSSLLPTLAAAI